LWGTNLACIGDTYCGHYYLPRPLELNWYGVRLYVDNNGVEYPSIESSSMKYWNIKSTNLSLLAKSFGWRSIKLNWQNFSGLVLPKSNNSTLF